MHAVMKENRETPVFSGNLQANCSKLKAMLTLPTNTNALMDCGYNETNKLITC
jgi:hypothetical protein